MILISNETLVTVSKQKHAVNNGNFEEGALEPVGTGPILPAEDKIFEAKRTETQGFTDRKILKRKERESKTLSRNATTPIPNHTHNVSDLHQKNIKHLSATYTHPHFSF